MLCKKSFVKGDSLCMASALTPTYLWECGVNSSIPLSLRSCAVFKHNRLRENMRFSVCGIFEIKDISVVSWQC